MSKLPVLTGPSQDPASGGAPEQLVVMVHGVGADGNDLIGLAPHFAQSLPGARFVSPDAPEPYDMAPNSAPRGRQWFSIGDLGAATLLAGVRRAAPILDGFIDAQLAAANLSEENLALVGFSQGTMMSLHVGLRRRRAPAGILAYSGRLIGAESLGAEIVSRPPVQMYHGGLDPLIPVAAMNEAITGLEAAGIEVASHVCPELGHGIDDVGIVGGAEFLARIFARPPG